MFFLEFNNNSIPVCCFCSHFMPVPEVLTIEQYRPTSVEALYLNEMKEST